MIYISMVLIFDLDDTLYDESTYVKSGFRVVAEYLEECGSGYAPKLFSRMLEVLDEQGREKVFDIVLNESGIYSKGMVKTCLSVYRQHDAQIRLYLGVEEILKGLASHSLYLVTDGNKLVQAAKVRALGIEKYFRRIFITHRFGIKAAKPSLHCFQIIKKMENCKWRDIVYVGDNPNKDFFALNKVGAKTVRVHTGMFSRVKAKPEYDAQMHIKGITEFDIRLLHV